MVAEAPASEVDARWIVQRTTRRSPSSHPAASAASQGREVLRLASVSLTAASGRRPLRDVSFTLRAGEVLGIYGLMGAGRTELLETLMGLHPESTGIMQLEGR